MPRSVNLARLAQPSLFQTAPAQPLFQRLPPDTQAKAILLLARLLRQAAERRLPGGQNPAVRDE